MANPPNNRGGKAPQRMATLAPGSTVTEGRLLNGRLDAVANAIQTATGMDFHLEQYSEHSLDGGSTSRAASYVGLIWGDGTATWGAGTDTDIIVAGIRALVSAINNK